MNSTFDGTSKMLQQSDAIFAVVGFILIFLQPVLIPVIVIVIAMEFWKRFNAERGQHEEANQTAPAKDQLTKLLNGYEVITFAEEAILIDDMKVSESIPSILLKVYIMKPEAEKESKLQFRQTPILRQHLEGSLHKCT
ncbi:unnamed protein product [Hymenolepis diminuta]|uniref:Uncharacterized protein n=1 Tax=Hymenolepis diminuta TaxID=6216 RepID=A0A564Z179_HYMDI|nr:unnamed protein product [Hymenolepis diminuta]